MATAATQIRSWTGNVDLQDAASTALASGVLVGSAMPKCQIDYSDALRESDASSSQTSSSASSTPSRSIEDLVSNAALALPSHPTNGSPDVSTAGDKVDTSYSNTFGHHEPLSVIEKSKVQTLIDSMQHQVFDAQLKEQRVAQSGRSFIFPTTNTVAEELRLLVSQGALKWDPNSDAKRAEDSSAVELKLMDLLRSLEDEKTKRLLIEDELRIEKRVKEGLMQEMCKFFAGQRGMTLTGTSQVSSLGQGANNRIELLNLLEMQPRSHKNKTTQMNPQMTTSLPSKALSIDGTLCSVSGSRATSPRSTPQIFTPEQLGDVMDDLDIDSSPESVKLYHKLVEQGYSEAQYKLGRLYEYGQGVEQNYTCALELYQQASSQGNVKAQYVLGLWNEKGVHTLKNEYDAFKYYKLASDQGYPPAQYSLGQCYFHGCGTSLNMTEAVKLFHLASDKNYSSAQNVLGFCFEKGTGVDKNAKKAAKLYRLAADQGHIPALFNVGRCYEHGIGVSKDLSKAVQHYRKASDLNYPEAHRKLGQCYEKGHGVMKDETKAFICYRKAAALGNSKAHCNLGYCYQHGIGIPRDEKEAFKMYKMAAEQGYEQAKGFLIRYSYECKEKAEELYDIVHSHRNRRKSLALPGTCLVAKHSYRNSTFSDTGSLKSLSRSTTNSQIPQNINERQAENDFKKFDSRSADHIKTVKSETPLNQKMTKSATAGGAFKTNDRTETSAINNRRLSGKAMKSRAQVKKTGPLVIQHDRHGQSSLTRNGIVKSEKTTNFNDLEEWL